MPPTTDGPQPTVPQDGQQAAEDAQADGYYGEDAADDDELDLSFLDDETPAQSDQPDAPEKPVR